MWLEQDEMAAETEGRDQTKNKKKKQQHGGESVTSPPTSTGDSDGSGTEKPGQAGQK